MATTELQPEHARLDVFRELAAALQTARAGTHGDRMAEYLLRFETGRDLVALGPDVERAIYHESASRSVAAVRFDKHGVYEGRQELLARGVDDPEAWIDAYGDGFEWTHPQYRESRANDGGGPERRGRAPPGRIRTPGEITDR